MEVYCPALVGRKRNPRVAQFLSGRHQREGEPGIGAGHELAIEFQVDARCITLAHILALVGNLQVLYVIRYEVGECFVIRLGRESERTVEHPEPVIHLRTFSKIH